MKHNKKLIQKIANEVEEEYGMGGLSSGLYFDFASDVAKRYAEKVNKKTVKELVKLKSI